MPPAMLFYFERCIQIWRRLNDALIWVLLGSQDHVIRTVCHRKERPQLASANPGPMRKLLDNLNADPKSIAIWTDATTCVDVGDIFCRAPRGRPNGFLEVKEGSMNDKIFELLKARGSPDQIAGEIEAFVQENGPKALKQLERVIRQRMRYSEVLDIVKNEKGYDSRRDAEITIEESEVELKTYDVELQAIIDEAAELPVLRSLDRCLWIYLDRDRKKSPNAEDPGLPNRSPKSRARSAAVDRTEFRRQVAFRGNPSRRESLYTRGVAPLPSSTKSGDDSGCAARRPDGLCLHVFGLAGIERNGSEQGAELNWSSFKDGRREQAKPYGQRKLTIGERVPRFQTKDGRFIEGFSKIYRIYFDGITPSSIVAQYVEMLQATRKQSNREAEFTGAMEDGGDT